MSVSVSASAILSVSLYLPSLSVCHHRHLTRLFLCVYLEMLLRPKSRKCQVGENNHKIKPALAM